MANVSVTAKDQVTGTSVDDTFTMEANVVAADGTTIDGGDGSNTLVVNETSAELLTAVGGGGSLVYTGGNNGGWEFDTAADGADLSATNMGTLQTSDGVSLVAGETAAGAAGAATTSGSSVDVLATTSFEWDGFELAVSDLSTDGYTTLVSVDGTNVDDEGPTWTNSDGAFEITTGKAGPEVSFTADAVAIAAQGNPGDSATFSYDVVVADADGNETTTTLTWSADVLFTAGDDTWTSGEDTVGDAIDETSDLGGEDAGNDTFNGNDFGVAGDGDGDVITAGLGDDTLNGNGGDDTLVGGDDSDVLNGGNGNDLLDESADTDGDNLLSGAGGNDILLGGAGDDELRGGGGDDSIDGSAGGENIMFGGNGNDTITASDNGDRLTGGTGDDSLIGGDGGDKFKGGDGADTLIGGAGDDTLKGGDGDDSITGNDGADLFSMSLGDGGDELILTDTDNAVDTIIVKADAGNTTVTDFDAGDGTTSEDLLDLSGLGITDMAGVLTVAYEVTPDGGPASTLIEIDADTTLTITGVALADWNETDFIFAS